MVLFRVRVNNIKKSFSLFWPSVANCPFKQKDEILDRFCRLFWPGFWIWPVCWILERGPIQTWRPWWLHLWKRYVKFRWFQNKIVVHILTLLHLGVISFHAMLAGCTNQYQISWLFPIIHPYFHLVKSFLTVFCNFYKNYRQTFCSLQKWWFFDENGQKYFFFPKYNHFCFKYVISMLW